MLLKAEYGFHHALDGITVDDVADILETSETNVLGMVKNDTIPGAKLIDGECLFNPDAAMFWFQHSYTRGRRSTPVRD